MYAIAFRACARCCRIRLDDPVVNKIEADAFPVMWVAVTSDRHSPMELTDYADRYLTDPMKAVPGVATVIIGGERRYAMRVWLDRERLAAHGMTAQDVEEALQAAEPRFAGRTHRKHAAGVDGACRRPICRVPKHSTT